MTTFFERLLGLEPAEPAEPADRREQLTDLAGERRPTPADLERLEQLEAKREAEATGGRPVPILDDLRPAEVPVRVAEVPAGIIGRDAERAYPIDPRPGVGLPPHRPADTREALAPEWLGRTVLFDASDDTTPTRLLGSDTQRRSLVVTAIADDPDAPPTVAIAPDRDTAEGAAAGALGAALVLEVGAPVTLATLGAVWVVPIAGAGKVTAAAMIDPRVCER